jgi:hypothetical protein
MIKGWRKRGVAVQSGVHDFLSTLSVYGALTKLVRCRRCRPALIFSQGKIGIGLVISETHKSAIETNPPPE